MKLSILEKLSKKPTKIIKDYKQERLNIQGRVQLKKMVDQGIELPVVPL